jgi:hypothetical protein
MYASVRRYRLDSGSVDDLMHRVDTGFAEMISRVPGFGAYEAIDCGDGTLCTVTIFHDAESADASVQRAAEWIAENLGDLDLERTDVFGGEIMVSRANRGVLEPAHH